MNNTLLIGLGLITIGGLSTAWYKSQRTYASSYTIRTCGKEGHFSHSDGGGTFSWTAIRLNNHTGMSNPYLFTMYETYLDGTSDHYIGDIIDLPSMDSDFITSDGNLGVLNQKRVSVSSPDAATLSVINKSQKSFFNMLPCYSGSYMGRGIQ
jgi:hypothetical protein|tara:strand:- start:72 stop:527 length:456 start_codon:yes stop_codon:yes gene_type:complete